MLETTASQCTTVAPLQGARISPDLLARHEGLVRWVVRQQWLGDLSFADALHEGRIGLWHALRGYDPARGTAFSSYAVVAITHAVWNAVASSRRSRGTLLPIPLEDEAVDPEEVAYASQVRAGLLALVERLPQRLRRVVVAHHGLYEAEPQSFAALGRTLGVTRQRVQQLHLDALLWLAHPAHSLHLRLLLGRNSRADCQRALARAYQVARRRRGSGRRGR